MATGGGPESNQTTVDPDIANITPHLMATAPCQFTSNMTELCLNSNLTNLIINKTNILNKSSAVSDVVIV